ncbi:MAG: DUF6377 domain-containing protein [Bacteroidales bacterium]|jgi:hypothetical protein|nr:DUF6377 domain-containing protein [Bacteroidales bacterium]
MKKLFILIVISLCSTLYAYPQLRNTLDEFIKKREYYDSQKESRLLEIKRMLSLPNLSHEQIFDINQKLYEEYKKYIIDSAIYYIRQNVLIADECKDTVKMTETLLYLSQLYSSAGMYLEAQNILNSIDGRRCLPLYYQSQSHFYNYYAQSNNQHNYFSINESYRDSTLLVLDKNSLQYRIIYAEKLMYTGRSDTASICLSNIFQDISDIDPQYGLVSYLLSVIYRWQGNIEQEKKHLMLSSIADIKNSSKDNASMQRLALLCYEQEEYDYAYKYLRIAVDDIVFCNVKFRTIELYSIYAIIDEAYVKKELREKSQLKKSTIIISFLSLLLIAAIVYVIKQLKYLSKTRKEIIAINVNLQELNQNLSEANEKQHRTNISLMEANQVKEIYIAQFFDLCSAYIDKMEEYRKGLNKLVVSRQHEALSKVLRDTTFADDEREKLYATFDTIFLSLYPTFIDDFNALLVSEEKIIVKKDERLNTELRVFALIRLGITDSVKIASFLRYSLSTIYNYRTKTRNKAAVPRDKFEEMVMKAGTVRQEV